MEIHHLAFRTADVSALASFYREMLGLEVVREAPHSVWLGIGENAVLMIETAGPGEAPVPVGSRELVAFRADQATRDAVRDRTRSAGCYDGETEWTVYFRDPDGRRIGVSTFELTSAKER